MSVLAAAIPQVILEYWKTSNKNRSWSLVILFSCPIWSFITNHSGADVGHPGPGVAKPSVTGIVFSCDEQATKYVALTEIQQPRVEIIESLQEMMERALWRFIEFKKRPPRRLIFFRDGVSEGEYNTVAAAEIKAIEGTLILLLYVSNRWNFFSAAIQTIVAGKDYKIFVTFIVVGKR